ncbi:MAG: hypothetical protein JWP95_833 [Actinotalea sp.]|nr:hypothetical protein [Actinotalea sp.]
MLELLAGTGLATAAGLNAALPLIVLGALDRWTSLVELPAQWAWLSDGWVLVILAVVLLADVVADKVPGADHINDIISTVVRPTAGGLAFGAGSGSETVAVTDPGTFFTSNAWVPVAIGVVLALTVHTGKALARPVVNAATLGVGGPVVSTAEDATSLALALSAVLLPVLVVVLLLVLVWAGVRALQRRAERRRRRDGTPALGASA